MPEVSIIVPIYNVEDYIERCLSSLVNQTFGDYEIILVDDHGKDDSINLAKKILDESAGKLYKIVHHKVNRGVSFSRNTGLEVASGKFILFVDGDDYIAPTMIEDMYSAAIDNNIKIAVCNFNIANISNGRITTVQLHWASRFIGKTSREKVIRSILSCEEPTFVWRQLFARELLCDIRFKEDVVIMEDTFFSLYALMKTDYVYFLDRALYNYVQTPGSAVKRFQPKITEVPLYMDKVRQDIVRMDNDLDDKFLFFKTKTFTSLVSMVALTAPTKKDAMAIFHYWQKNISRKDIEQLFSNGNKRLSIWLILFKSKPMIFYWWHNWRDQRNRKV